MVVNFVSSYIITSDLVSSPFHDSPSLCPLPTLLLSLPLTLGYIPLNAYVSFSLETQEFISSFTQKYNNRLIIITEWLLCSQHVSIFHLHPSFHLQQSVSKRHFRFFWKWIPEFRCSYQDWAFFSSNTVWVRVYWKGNGCISGSLAGPYWKRKIFKNLRAKPLKELRASETNRMPRQQPKRKSHFLYISFISLTIISPKCILCTLF